jgi:hypothetical protein
MTRHLCAGALVACLASGALAGQTGPRAMSGLASSARHCVSGDAANVHGIGWVATGTSYTITFDAEIPLTTAVARVDLAGSQSASAFGAPDLRFTASTPGSMALYVGGRGQAGCYRYKVEIQQAAASVTPASRSTALPALAPLDPARYPIGTLAISGSASSATHCVTGNAAKIHGIGRIEQGAVVRITFESDFDPVAGITLVNFVPERGTYLVDNDTGGDREPLLYFTASQSGTLALHVASVNGRAGCYRYQVQIDGGATPAPSPSPTPPPTFADFNGSWVGTFSGTSSGTLALTVANSAITVTQPNAGSGSISLGALEAPASFFTRGDLGECTWTGPFLPGGARQSSASGQWSCGNARFGTWSATRRATPAPTPAPTPPGPAPAPAPPGTGGPGILRIDISRAPVNGGYEIGLNRDFPVSDIHGVSITHQQGRLSYRISYDRQTAMFTIEVTQVVSDTCLLALTNVRGAAPVTPNESGFGYRARGTITGTFTYADACRASTEPATRPVNATFSIQTLR